MDQVATVPFLAIVHALRDAGMKLSVRDLLQGIEALEAIGDPFTYLAPVAEDPATRRATDRHRRAKRDQLVWLAQILWARSEAEREIVRRAVENITPAPPRYALELRRVTERPAAPSGDRDTIRSPSDEPLKDLTATDAAEAGKTAKAADETADDVETGAADAPGRSEQVAVNLPVPAIEDTTLGQSVTFELEDVPMLDELALASVWRRFRQPVLRTDHGRPDIELSIDATIRAGGQLTVVPARRRINQARLLVLLDAGVPMAPWETMRRQFELTLDPAASRLEQVAIWYFVGIPGTKLYADKSLRQGRAIRDVLRDWSGEPMLVFSEAGAARQPAAGFETRLSEFLAVSRQADIRPLVWINPMPKARWPPAFRQRMEQEGSTSAFPLSHEGLIAAVSVMREQAR